MFDYYFHKVVCLSLKERQDRREAFAAQASKFGFNFYFVTATPGTEKKALGIVVKDPFSQGHNHASYAHNQDIAELLQGCLGYDIESILFFEDDCVLESGVLEILNHVWQMEMPNNWDLMYLGAFHHEKPIQVGTYLYKVVKAVMSHAVAIHRRVMPLLLHHCEENKQLFDFILANKIQPLGLSYCLYPDMAKQADGYSDIWKKDIKRSRHWK